MPGCLSVAGSPLYAAHCLQRREFLAASFTAALLGGTIRSVRADFDPDAWLKKRKSSRFTQQTPQSGRPLQPIASRSLDEWRTERKLYEMALWELIGPWPKVRPALHPKIVTSEKFERWTRFKVAFQTLSSTSVVASTIPAWLFVPHSGPAKKPALITVHQTVPQGKDEPAGLKTPHEWMKFAEEYAGRGYITLALDMIGFGERTTGGYAETGFEWEDAAPILADSDLTLLGLMLFDLSRSVDFLLTREDVAVDRIGIMGHSLGGILSNLMLALEPRLAVGVASCGYGLFRQDELFPERWAAKNSAYLPRMALYRGEPDALPLDFHQILALAAPKPHLIQTAMGDTIWTLPAVAQDDFVIKEIRRVRHFYGKEAARNLVAIQPLNGAKDRDHGWYPESQQAAELLLDRVLRPKNE